jgi:magnesium chelatase family protein
LTTIYSVCGLASESGLIAVRPCRCPHHTISTAGLIGGGPNLLPGELSLAHRGVLFLDELGEFRRDSLEVLRQPLETGVVSIGRALGHVEYPAQVTLIAATNPCPCGYLGSKKRACSCTPMEIERYRRKLSGPILDRLEMQIFVSEVAAVQLEQAETQVGESSEKIRTRVQRARKRQAHRWREWGVLTNRQLTSVQVRRGIKLTPAAKTVLTQAVDKWHLSARSYFKLIKVARTIADLQEEETMLVEEKHLTEALAYRQNAAR